MLRITSTALRAHDVVLDLSNPKKNWNKTPGYTEEETSSFARILNPPEDAKDAAKFIDAWRARHPDDHHYTYFSYRFNCRGKGIGWRLDTCKGSPLLPGLLADRPDSRAKPAPC